ncbi:GGDEF domain-containing protein [Pseudoxanthobacter sp. M-2]|uniref:GGDEF domain-containing protein n=1 Tax=Pseudoxanthobacter sp. M-2 TaxID=3078754 RepID=UPI0038FD30E3
MMLDVGTILVATIAGCAVLGCLMLVDWWQSRDTYELAWWGTAYLFGALSLLALIGRRTIAPDLLYSTSAALMLFGYGCLWIGVRRFFRRRQPIGRVLTLCILWLALAQLPVVQESASARTAIVSGLVAALSFAIAYDFWRNRSERLASRVPAMIICSVHGLFFAARVPFAEALSLPTDLGSAPVLYGILALEGLVFVIASGFTFVALTKERAEVAQRRAATIDSLTGVYNRRAFLDRAERLVRRAETDTRPLAVLLFDIDRFKQINDRFGHPVGDRLLIEFTTLATQLLRPTDLFGRIGGEEFAAILPGAPRTAAVAAADRVRAAFASVIVTEGEADVRATVSVGVTVVDGEEVGLDRLIAIDDRALYRAKRNGRNVVEVEPGTADAGA